MLMELRGTCVENELHHIEKQTSNSAQSFQQLNDYPVKSLTQGIHFCTIDTSVSADELVAYLYHVSWNNYLL